LSKLKAAGDNTDEIPYALRRRSLIGPTSTYLTSLPVEKLGDFDSRPGPSTMLAKVYGDEEARRLQDIRRRCVKNQEIYVITYDPTSVGGRPHPQPTNIPGRGSRGLLPHGSTF